MDYAELYYSEVVGESPGIETHEYRQTVNVFAYLKEANIPDADILRFLDQAPAKMGLTFDDLPEWLWEESLLEPNTFYYHRRLHIISPPPSYSVFRGRENRRPFSIEMVIRFSIEDLADYFYEKVKMPAELIDKKRDQGALNHLLNRYQKMKFVSSVDFVLSLIDYAAEKTKEGYKIMDVFSVKSWEGDVHEKLSKQEKEASVRKRNRIVWRESS